jgi:hypothetical protein
LAAGIRILHRTAYLANYCCALITSPFSLHRLASSSLFGLVSCSEILDLIHSMKIRNTIVNSFQILAFERVSGQIMVRALLGKYPFTGTAHVR